MLPLKYPPFQTQEIKKHHRPLWFRNRFCVSVCEMVFKFGWLRNIQKDSQWSYRVCRGKINVYETFKFKSVYLKQAKQNTGGVSVSRRTDRLQLSQNSHTAWTRPKHGAKSVPCCQSAPTWSFCLSSPPGSPALGEGEEKASSLMCRSVVTCVQWSP